MKIKPFLLSSLFALSAASSAFAQSPAPSVVPKAANPDEEKAKITVLGQSNMVGAGVSKAGLDKGWALSVSFAHNLTFLGTEEQHLFGTSNERVFRAEAAALHKIKGPLVWNLGGSYESIAADENIIGPGFSFPDKEAIGYGGFGLRLAFGRTGIMFHAGLQASNQDFYRSEGHLKAIWPKKFGADIYGEDYSFGREYWRYGAEGAIGLPKGARVEFRADNNKDDRAHLVVPVSKKFSVTGGWDRRFGTGVGGRLTF